MPKSKKSVYDTRFFIDFFYSSKKDHIEKLKADLIKIGHRIISVITIHEIYRLTLAKEGREIAALRCAIIRKDFTVIDVDYDIAIESAEMKNIYSIPLADSIIAVTARNSFW